MRICPDCHKVVPALGAVEIGGKYYHKSCRICHKCGKVINDDFLHPKQEFEGHSYHFSCLHAAQTCCICGKVTHRYVRDYWGNVACEEHGAPCQYCGSIVKKGQSFKYTYIQGGERITLNKQICDKCASSIVKTPEQIERCRREVMDIFKVHGITGIPDDIPISLSDMREESEKKGMGIWGLNYGRISSSRSRYSCEISIHENLPYLVFKGVLAHELLHSWIALYAIKLPDNEEEGLCNLGKFLILKQEKSKEADYLIQWALEENKDPVYGDGYRLMKKRLEKLGWKGLMDALLWENKAPEHIDL